MTPSLVVQCLPWRLQFDSQSCQEQWNIFTSLHAPNHLILDILMVIKDPSFHSLVQSRDPASSQAGLIHVSKPYRFIGPPGHLCFGFWTSSLLGLLTAGVPCPPSLPPMFPTLATPNSSCGAHFITTPYILQQCPSPPVFYKLLYMACKALSVLLHIDPEPLKSIPLPMFQHTLLLYLFFGLSRNAPYFCYALYLLNSSSSFKILYSPLLWSKPSCFSNADPKSLPPSYTRQTL